MSEFETEFADALAAVPDDQFDESQFVPGVGPLDAAVVLAGEAPGADEVAAGEPFVGRAGTQLDRAIDALGVERSDLYITNLVKVRPPENRNPHVAEIEAWQPVLEAELDRISPAVVVPLGTTATRALLDTDEGITDVHGRKFERDGRRIVPAYHPAASLYDESKRGALEEDLAVAFEVADRADDE